MESATSWGNPLKISTFVVRPLSSAWRHRELILRLALRDLYSAFRGSLFGWLWLVAAPLGLIAFYSVSISAIPSLAGLAEKGGRFVYPLFIFCGLIYFQMFSELVIRAPQLMLENVGFIKKVIFPVDILAWVAVARSMVASTVLMCILIIFAILVQGAPSPAIILLPVIFGSFCLTLLGIIWTLSVLGVFVRDLTYFIASVMPALLLATPLFYSAADLGDIVQPFIYLNPMTFYVESTREIVVDRAFPHWSNVLGGLALAAVIFAIGYAIFLSARNRIVDAL